MFIVEKSEKVTSISIFCQFYRIGRGLIATKSFSWFSLHIFKGHIVRTIWYGPYDMDETYVYLRIPSHMILSILYGPCKMGSFTLRIMWYKTNPKVPFSKQSGETSVPSLSKINSAWYESWAGPSSIVRFFGFKILECIKSKIVSFKRRSFWSDWTQEYPLGSFTNQKPKTLHFRISL